MFETPEHVYKEWNFFSRRSKFCSDQFRINSDQGFSYDLTWSRNVIFRSICLLIYGKIVRINYCIYIDKRVHLALIYIFLTHEPHELYMSIIKDTVKT